MKPAAVFFLTLISLVLYVAASLGQGSAAPSSDAAIFQRVDSLNQAAFEAKRSSVDQALTLLHQAARLAEEHRYTSGYATNLVYEAGIYQQHGYTKKALVLYYKALDLSTQSSDTLNIARANQQIAKALLEAGNLGEAERLYREAKQGYAALRLRDDLVNITNSLGLVKLKQREMEAAELYFTEAMTSSREGNYGYGLKKAYYHLGLLSLQLGNLGTAKDYFLRSLHLDEQKGDSYGLALTEIQLSETALREGAHEHALSWASAALGHAQIVLASELEEAAVDKLIDVHRVLGNSGEIIQWQDVLIERQKQAFEQGKDQALSFLDLLKEKQEERLLYARQALEARQKAEWTYRILSLAGLGLVLLSFLAYMWHKSYRKAKEYGAALAAKNEELGKKSIQLDQLYQTTVLQNKSLEENNLMKDRLFSIVSHDLRSPLASLKGLLNLANRRSMSHEEVKPFLAMLQREVEVVADMLNNLLDWSKTQLKGVAVALEPISLKQLVEENRELVLLQASQKGIELENAVPKDAVALADRERLNFVVRNLLMNAVKFSYRGGHVVIHAEGSADHVELRVTDSGTGIAADKLGRLFKGSERFTTNGTAKERGTGLGLKLSKDFVVSMSGTIGVDSKEQEGSTFLVTLPKPPPAGAAAD
ncbi:ATP-binding protein [Pontibacter sp. 13R65]|uniref:sensor histidine kinase n=1 Tax=Pontibacter sp. 13R65 TaxID=3127458 RepID=UPI00301C2C55